MTSALNRERWPTTIRMTAVGHKPFLLLLLLFFLLFLLHFFFSSVFLLPLFSFFLSFFSSVSSTSSSSSWPNQNIDYCYYVCVGKLKARQRCSPPFFFFFFFNLKKMLALEGDIISVWLSSQSKRLFMVTRYTAFWGCTFQSYAVCGNDDSWIFFNSMCKLVTWFVFTFVSFVSKI